MNVAECRFSEEQVLDFVTGELEADEELRFAEHLPDCEDCRDGAAAYMELTAALPASCVDGAIRWHGFESPFGAMYVAASDSGLVRLSWRHPGPDAFAESLERRFPRNPVIRHPDALAGTERELREYFAGERTRFDLPVDLDSLTSFQRAVLRQTTEVPFGQVTHYSELARRIARPRAARAVGNALGNNPVAIVVPCHRIIRRDGSLGGYTGGVGFKERLLELEGRGHRIPGHPL